MADKVITILIIDDNPEDQFIYRTYIKKDRENRYTFLEANTGEQGLAALQQNQIDCVLLDYNLPDFDGLEFLKQPGIKPATIFLTGVGNETIAVEAMKLGALDYLIKDKVNSEILIRSIKYSIGKKMSLDAEDRHTRFLETLIDTIPSPVFFKDKHSIFRGCNKAFATLIGKSKEEIIGRPDSDIVPEDVIEKSRSAESTLYRTPGVESFEETLSIDGKKIRHVIINLASYADIYNEVEGIVGVITDITERKNAEEQVKRLALYDDLTNLPNRRLFFDRLSHAITRAKRKGNYVAIFYMDLNGFKGINDTYGHETGDEVLRKVGKRIDSTLRKADTAARLGGDEFGIILSDLEDIDGTMTVAEKLTTTINQPMVIEGNRMSLIAALGISVFPTDGKDLDDLLNKADQAMYQAKSISKKEPNRSIAYYAEQKKERKS